MKAAATRRAHVFGVASTKFLFLLTRGRFDSHRREHEHRLDHVQLRSIDFTVVSPRIDDASIAEQRRRRKAATLEGTTGPFFLIAFHGTEPKGREGPVSSFPRGSFDLPRRIIRSPTRFTRRETGATLCRHRRRRRRRRMSGLFTPGRRRRFNGWFAARTQRREILERQARRKTAEFNPIGRARRD
jgi:hypothetical protein